MLFLANNLQAQHSISLSIRSAAINQPLAGATVTIMNMRKTAVADSTGQATFPGIPAGRYTLAVTYTGFADVAISLTVPMESTEPVQVLMEPAEDDEDEVVVTSTRTSRSFRDMPTRVETISGEELAEKANMKPGDIRMLLSESTGIQTQQTSATSYNSSIRIQGLDGRYTQVLKDGFPLYAGFSGGLSLMQVAPLDLKQIEVIKGSSSTLYGGGAIAGLVNLVSKTPVEKREISFLANGTSARGLDLSGFYSQRFKKTGITVFGSRNTSDAYDPAHIGLTAIPAFKRYTINPTLFFYGNKSTIRLGTSYITERRTGGSLDYINRGTPGYFEYNKTERLTSQVQVGYHVNDQAQFNFKASYSRFNRLIEIPAYTFAGTQQAVFSEASFNLQQKKVIWVFGANFLVDQFAEKAARTTALRDYQNNTLGAFVQNTWTAGSFFTLETGLRADYVNHYGLAWLPRLSAMLKITPALTARLGGGAGYKTPSVFNEDAEKAHFQHILPLRQSGPGNERSDGVNLDINYRRRFGNFGITLNQLFFFTRLNDPLVLTAAGNNRYEFTNAAGHIDTRGLETNVRLSYDAFKLFLGYTYADVNTHFNHVKSWLPLTARHRLNNVLMYEKEGKIKIGAEAYYFSQQKLSDGETGRGYWTFGLMGEKYWRGFSIFINFENFTDTRQTRFDTIFTGPIDQPVFRDIYAPVDGFVVNGGIKISL